MEKQLQLLSLGDKRQQYLQNVALFDRAEFYSQLCHISQLRLFLSGTLSSFLFTLSGAHIAPLQTNFFA